MGNIQIRDINNSDFLFTKSIWTNDLFNILKPKEGNLDAILMIMMYQKPVLFIGTPSGNIICQRIDPQAVECQTQTFAAHTDVDSLFGEYNQA